MRNHNVKAVVFGSWMDDSKANTTEEGRGKPPDKIHFPCRDPGPFL